MTATPPKSSATLEGLPVSRSTVRRLRRARGLPPSAGAGPASTAPAARAARPWAASSSSTAASSTGSAPAPPSFSSAPSTTRRAPSWPCTSGPRRICTAISPCSGASPRATGLPVTLYGDRLGVFVRNDAHWSLEEELQGAQHPPSSARSSETSRSATSAPTRPRPRAASSASGKPCRTASSPSSASHGIQTVEAAEAFLPTYLVDHNRRFAPPPADAAACPSPKPCPIRLASIRALERWGGPHPQAIGPRHVKRWISAPVQAPVCCGAAAGEPKRSPQDVIHRSHSGSRRRTVSRATPRFFSPGITAQRGIVSFPS